MAKRIFITGGIGSGKSTLLDFLRSQGVATVEADKVGHASRSCGESIRFPRDDRATRFGHLEARVR